MTSAPGCLGEARAVRLPARCLASPRGGCSSPAQGPLPRARDTSSEAPGVAVVSAQRCLCLLQPDAGSGCQHACLPHPSAQQLPHAPGLRHKRPAAGEHGPSRGAQALGVQEGGLSTALAQPRAGAQPLPRAPKEGEAAACAVPFQPQELPPCTSSPWRSTGTPSRSAG